MPTVEPFDTKDCEALFDLYSRVSTFPPSAMLKKYWEWRYLANPVQSDSSPHFWVVRSRERIIGAMGQMSFLLNIHGRPQEIFWGVDLMVDPEFRGQGIATALAQHLRQFHPLVVCMGWDLKSSSAKIFRRAEKANKIRVSCAYKKS